MDTEQKWTISEDVLKEAFGKIGIDDAYYSIFKNNAISRFYDSIKGFESEGPDQEDYDNSIYFACKYVMFYVAQIELGFSELWSRVYVDNFLFPFISYSFVEIKNQKLWLQEDCAHATYDKVCQAKGKDYADKYMRLYAHYINDDPIFIENYLSYFFESFGNAEEATKQFLSYYYSLVKKGKSKLYAKKYAEHCVNGYSEGFCELYASKYEECIIKGRDEEIAERIARTYEIEHEKQWPNDNYTLGIEAIKAYMKGFEYAIDNGIDSPYDFAKEYEKEAIAMLFPDEKEPPGKVKGKYDDLIKRLYPIK